MKNEDFDFHTLVSKFYLLGCSAVSFPLTERQQHIIKTDSRNSINRAAIANEMAGASLYIGLTVTPDRCVLLGYWGQFLGEWNTWKCDQIILQSNEDGNSYGLLTGLKHF